MNALAPYFARIAAGRVAEDLTPAIGKAITEIADLLAEDGRVNVARIHQQVFPLAANVASANASLNKVLHEFNHAAERANRSVRVQITHAKRVGAPYRFVWFAGPAVAPRTQRTPELNAVPDGRLIENQRGEPIPERPVVVLLTVNQHETQAVLRAFRHNETPPQQSIAGITYNDLGLHGDVQVWHVVCEQGSGSVGGAQSRTTAAICAWNPRAVIAVGVAFGVNDAKQNIGDVLVSTHICAYDLDRRNADGSVTPRGSKPDASAILVNRGKTLDQTLSDADRHAWNWPKLHFGTVLSGAKLVDNLDERDRLVQLYDSEAIGGEMEGTGLYVSAVERHVDWIVVKAICDWADGEKGHDKDQRQQLAAHNAATVVLHMLEAPGLFSGGQSAKQTATATPAVERCAPQRRNPKTAEMGLRDAAEVGVLVSDMAGRPATLHQDRAEQLQHVDGSGVDAMAYLLQWVRDADAPDLFALLGEYGMGKTITCQRLAQQLEEQRTADASLPLPLYFDLRNVTGFRDGVPTLAQTLERCVSLGWHATGDAFDLPAFEQAVDQGALVILDGLDEALVKLSEADGQTYTNHLIKLLDDARVRRERTGTKGGREPKLLVSCRTQFFRTLRDQKGHFTGQERGGRGPDGCRALLLLPFGEAQVRRYLQEALPDADPERLAELIRSVHNLEDLTRRPYTLKLVSEFVPEIEADRAAGRVVRGVTLYRRMAMRWLDRDQGKHQVRPEHKLRLVRHLAAEMARTGGDVLPVERLEAWFHAWLDDQPDLRHRYAKLQPDQLEEDLRTATFLARVDGEDGGSGFRFAHTSLREFFLADYLLDAVRDDRPDRWAMPLPSRETVDFLGQLLDEAERERDALLRTMQAWRRVYRQGASELLLRYAVTARVMGWPMPILHGIDMRGARLRGWRFGGLLDENGTLDLGPAVFAGADLRETRLYAVRAEGADFSDALLNQAEFHDSRLSRAVFDRSEADGALFHGCSLDGSRWEGARTWRTRFVAGAPAECPVGSLVTGDAGSQRPAGGRLELYGGHGGSVSSCAFSPDGARLLSAGEDGTLRLWDARSGECLRVYEGHRGGIWSCAISPDGACLYSAGSDGTLRLWDTCSGGCIGVHEGRSMWFNSCAFSPDSARMLSAGIDGTLRLWDTISGQCIRAYEEHKGEVLSCAFSRDGASLLSAGKDGTLRLWDASSGECIRVHEGHSSWVYSCAFSPDGKRLLSAGNDGILRLWDANSGECIRVHEGRAGWIFSCTFSPDGARLLSGGDDGTLQLWDANSGECIRVHGGHSDWVLSCAFSPDGAQVLSASGDGTLRLWDCASGDCIRVYEGQSDMVWSCAFSPDGARLLSGAADGTLRLWDASSGECIRVHEGHSSWVYSCAFSPDGARLLAGGLGRTLRLWDASSGECIHDLKVQSGSIWSCAISPDGAHLLSGGLDGTLQLRDSSSGECIRVYVGHKGRIASCAFSPDGARLLSASDDGTLRLWDAGNGALIRVHNGHGGRVFSCVFSPDGALLLSAGQDGILRQWDAASGECMRVHQGHSGGVNSCAFSPDGAHLLSAGDDGTLRLWDASSGACVRVHEGHRGRVLSCAFSPDCARLLSAGRDGTLRLWDTASGICIRIHATRQGAHAAWEPATSHLIEASGDAWRWLQWEVEDANGERLPVPLESFGPVPGPQRLQAVCATSGRPA